MNSSVQNVSQRQAHPDIGMQTAGRSGEQSEQLPFDPRTLLLGLFRRWPILVVSVILFSLLGILGGIKFGSRSFVATATLLYKPSEDGGRGDLVDMPSLIRMVKLQPNLAEVRRRLELPVTLEYLDKICDVENPRGSAMMILSARWSSGETAASIANALRDVFIENQQSVRKATQGREVRDLEDRLVVTRRQWGSAENSLRDFLTTHRMIDPNLEAEAYIQELSVLDQIFQRAMAEKESAKILGEKTDLASGRSGHSDLPSSMAPDISGANARVQNLIQAIQQERIYQANMASLEKARSEFEIAEKLRERGLISENEFQTARAIYEREKAFTTDSEQIKALKEELATVLTDRVERLEDARESLQAKIEALPQLQRQYIELSREVAFREGLKKTLEERVAWARQAFESNAQNLIVISNAAVPVIPDSSSRKLLAIGIALIGSILGFVLILGLEFMDTTIKSAADFSNKFALPLVGVLPKVAPDEPVFPDGLESELTESFRILTRSIRQKIPERGARILFVSATQGEGTTSVAANLAMCFGRMDERVLLLDAQVREGEHDHELRTLIPEDTPASMGLGEYLSFEANSPHEVVSPTIFSGVSCIPRIKEAVIPDLVGSKRMAELIEEVSQRFSLVLIDAPPVLNYVDTQSLVQWADAVVLVVKSRHRRVSVIRDAVQRLETSGASNIMAVLNGVPSLYL